MGFDELPYSFGTPQNAEQISEQEIDLSLAPGLLGTLGNPAVTGSIGKLWKMMFLQAKVFDQDWKVGMQDLSPATISGICWTENKIKQFTL